MQGVTLLQRLLANAVPATRGALTWERQQYQNVQLAHWDMGILEVGPAVIVLQAGTPIETSCKRVAVSAEQVNGATELRPLALRVAPIARREYIQMPLARSPLLLSRLVRPACSVVGALMFAAIAL